MGTPLFLHSLIRASVRLIATVFLVSNPSRVYPQLFIQMIHTQHAMMNIFLSHGSFNLLLLQGNIIVMTTQQISVNIHGTLFQCDHLAVIMQRLAKDRYDFLKSVWNRWMDKKNGLHT